MILEGLLGGLLGGAARLAPELLKIVDRKNERKHELEMTRLQIEQVKATGALRLDEKEVDVQIAQFGALAEAFKEQTATAGKSYPWVAAVSALVRPAVTWMLVGMYMVVKFYAIKTAAIVNGITFTQAMAAIYGAEDLAMLNMVLSFWFVGRVYERR